MSHLSKIFTSQKVDVPNRSGFDLSHENMLTMKVGTLTPVLCEEVLPNETFSLGHMTQVQLPPMATDFYGRVDFRLEAFFVPNRVIWGGWQNFYTMPQNNPYGTPVVRPTTLPSILVSETGNTQAGSLSDYLGCRLEGTISSSSTLTIQNALPFYAYHKIYDDWYRNTKLQKPVFVREKNNAFPRNMPWNPDSGIFGLNAVLGDGVALGSLRQRNYAKDYFTTAALYPQANGSADGSQVVSTVDTGAEESSFTIAQLRQANVLQRWLERNNIAGERYADQIKATFGIMPSDSMLDRSLLLGSASFSIYNKSVYTTGLGPSNSQNPMGFTPASKFGNSNGIGQDSLIDKFTSTEHGYIIVLASIVPHAQYGTGTRRLFKRSKVGDFANPLLQGLGEQTIMLSELIGTYSPTSVQDTEFGYQQQYSEYKYHDDEVHGLLRDDQSLASFALQRSFKEKLTELGTDFIQIPTTAMDGVSAVRSTVSTYGAWADIFFSLKKVSPLSEYVIPTLGDLRNTHKEEIPYRGNML